MSQKFYKDQQIYLLMRRTENCPVSMLDIDSRVYYIFAFSTLNNADAFYLETRKLSLPGADDFSILPLTIGRYFEEICDDERQIQKLTIDTNPDILHHQNFMEGISETESKGPFVLPIVEYDDIS